MRRASTRITGGSILYAYIGVSVTSDAGFLALGSQQNAPTRLALSPSGVYCTKAGRGGAPGCVGAIAITAKPVAAGTANGAVTMIGGQCGPFGIAVDSTTVYWTNNGDGCVMKAFLR